MISLNQMKYLDIHSHLDHKDYDADRQEVLTRMKEKEVGTITIGDNLESSKKAVEIAEQNEDVWACIGIHPEHISLPPLNIRGGQGVIFEEKEFEKLVKSSKVVGIGECGLDYFYSQDEEVKNIQKNLFESHIQFAIKHDKPLMLHIREAYDDALEILNNYKKEAGEKLRGDIHFFAGDKEIAKKFLDLGFTLSFTGVITFTHDYDEVIKYIPHDRIMSETDAPFVAPVPFRGKRNEPVYVIEVIKKLAEICGEDPEILNNSILANAKRVFGV
jgi:TatD DNase family protein